MSLRALGVSTGRAGSTFTATVMERAGIPCLHETHFHGDHCLAEGRQHVWNHDETVEWSAQAVPYLDWWVTNRDIQVWHQVRHPLATVASFLQFGLFDRPYRWGRPGAVLWSKFTPVGPPIADAVRFWVDWNRRCETGRRYRRWRVEDLDAPLLVDLAADIGVDIPKRQADIALEFTPTDTNTRGKPAPVAWSSLPDIPETQQMTHMATRYGYEVH